MYINIKMIYCQSKQEETRSAHYNHNTTIGEILNTAYPERREKLICDIKTKRIIEKIDYLYIDGVFRWGENPYEVLVEDFIAKYPECKKEGLLCYTDIGGFGSPIDTIMELWQEIERFARDNPIIISLLGAAITQAISRLKKWVLGKSGRIDKDTLKNAVHSQKQWSIEQAQKAFSTESIEELIIIMEYMGYHYSENEKLFSEIE